MLPSTPALAATVVRYLAAEGIEADLEFTDLSQFVTKPGTLRVRELRPGQLVLRNVSAGFTLVGTNQITVTQASFQMLGGKTFSLGD